METDKRDEMRDYAWKYFSMHADQRLKAFNFYLIIIAVILGGVFAYIKDARHPWLVFPVCLLLSVVSFVFFKLDVRTRDLIRYGKEALKRIERDACEDGVPPELCIIGNEEAATEAKQTRHPLHSSPTSWLKAYLTYSLCFQLVFWLFGLFGIVLAAAVFFIPPPGDPATIHAPNQQFFIGAQPTQPDNPHHQP